MADNRLTVTVPLIGARPEWDEQYLNACMRMGADSVFLMAPYDNIVRSRVPVPLSFISDDILPPIPEQRICDLPSLALVRHWASVYQQSAKKYTEHGMKPFFWLCHTIGHGGELSGSKKAPFQPLVGASGEEAHGCYCPLDSGFRQYLLEVLSILAEAQPPMILLDDDFRLNYHMPAVDIGCFCPLHVARFNQRNNTHYTREELANRFFQNVGDTRKRFMESAGSSMLEFASDIEKTVHRISPTTRIGLAVGMMHFSTEGYSVCQMARTLAGATRPYVRLFGAPYHVKNNLHTLGFTIEYARFEHHILQESDIEVASEGDTYPHTCFFTDQTVTKDYLIAARCAGLRNMLYYPFAFSGSPAYEQSYVEIAENLKPLMQTLDKLLPGDEKPLGISPVLSLQNLPHIPLTRDMTKREIIWPDEPVALKTLSQFGIPTSPFRELESQPVLITGYNAYGLTDEALDHLLDRGAILDATAASWLLERGHDIGITAIDQLADTPAFELYHDCQFSPVWKDEQVWLLCPEHTPFFALTPKTTAEITSSFIHGETGTQVPATIAYTNKNRRVFILGFDFYSVRASFQVLNNVARAEQLRRVAGWLGVAPLVEENLFLYEIAYQKGSQQIIFLFNLGGNPCTNISLRFKEKPTSPILYLDSHNASLRECTSYRILHDQYGFLLQIEYPLQRGEFVSIYYNVSEGS